MSLIGASGTPVVSVEVETVGPRGFRAFAPVGTMPRGGAGKGRL
jgi:hypothetical protein